MTQQTINIGATTDDHTGDPLRTAFQKVNGNFTELYAGAGATLGYAGTSTTNVPIATGPVTVTTQANMAYQVGARTRLSYTADPTQWMEGIITAYTGTSLTVNVDLTSSMATISTPPIIPGMLFGLTLSNDLTSPNTVLDIAMGGATSDDASTTMILNQTNFTKNCNAAWAAGSGSGALDSGSALAANTWYHVFLIYRTDTSTIGVLISTSATAPVMPTNYTKKRRIGSILTNASSQIVAFMQYGDQFSWATPVNNYSNVGITTTAALVNVTTPPGVKTIWHGTVYMNVSGSYATFNHGDLPLPAPFSPAGNLQLQLTSPNTTGGSDINYRTNLSSQIGAVAGVTIGSGFYLVTKGWIDYRGK